MEDKLLIAEYRLGIEAEVFLATDLGKYIEGCAEQEKHMALEALATVDPHDAKAVMALQQRIQVAEAVPVWLREIIVKSHQAEIALEQR